jgi:uncharacterized protein YndB with AHSA1/START domain
MRIGQTFTIARPPEEVFAFMVDAGNLARWQTIKIHVTPLTEGPPRVGYRVREGNKVGPREWEQVVEFTEFEPGRAFTVKVVEGPESSGRWTMAPETAGTVIHFESEVKAPRLLAPILRPLAERQFRGYHQNLRRELEGAPTSRGGPSDATAGP